LRRCGGRLLCALIFQGVSAVSPCPAPNRIDLPRDRVASQIEIERLRARIDAVDDAISRG
jgi:hypothetical protein